MAAAVAASMGNMSPLGILVVSVFCVTACRASSFSPPSAWQPSWLSLESDMKIAGTHPPKRHLPIQTERRHVPHGCCYRSSHAQTDPPPEVPHHQIHLQSC